MKRYLSHALIAFFTCLSLIGCAAQRNQTFNPNLAQETWMRQVQTNPNYWTIGADRWFLTGDPNGIEIANHHAPYNAAITTMMVRVPNFTNIKAIGDFEVQIFGTSGRNSVYVYGPNDATRQLSIQVRGNTLCVTQTRPRVPAMRRLIVRIGINNLNNLYHAGCGVVEGVWLNSNGLSVTSAGIGNIYLSGAANLQRINQSGTGSINILGANTGCLDINTWGPGAVNVSGHIGLRRVMHHGGANINVIGAYKGPGLKIYADGGGKIGINGLDINLAEVRAKDSVCVFVYSVNSYAIYAYAHQKARIGIAGRSLNLYAETSDNAVFYGRYLCSQDAFVRAYDASHINVAASNKIFASAVQNASVYFYGSPEIISQFVSGNGLVIPIWGQAYRSCAPVALVAPRVAPVHHYRWKKRPVDYKYAK